MAGVEVLVDSRPTPDAIPADAVVVFVWLSTPTPARWDFVAVVTGAATLEAALTESGAKRPDLAGRMVCATKIGGKSGLVKRIRRREDTNVTVTLE